MGEKGDPRRVDHPREASTQRLQDVYWWEEDRARAKRRVENLDTLALL